MAEAKTVLSPFRGSEVGEEGSFRRESLLLETYPVALLHPLMSSF